MKKSIFLLFLLLNVAKVYAQDIIILKSGDEIKSIVSEVLSDQIKYKKFDNKQGPSYGIEKSKVFMIRYANGSKDVFNEQQKVTKPTISRAVYVEPRQQQTTYRAAPVAHKSYSNSYNSSVRNTLFGGVTLPTGYFADYQGIGFFVGDEADIPIGNSGLNITLNGSFSYFTAKDVYYYNDGTSFMVARIMPGLKFIAPVSDNTELYGVGLAGIGIGIGEGAKTQFNFGFGVGATFNEHLDVSMRYLGASNTSDYYNTYIGPNAFALSFGYKF